MNLGKAFGVAKIPVIVLVVLAAITPLMNLIPVVGEWLACIVGIPLFVIGILLYLWLGYLIYKAKLEIVDAAITGGLTGAIASIVGGVISFIANMLGLGVGMATGGSDMLGAALGAGLSIVGIVMGMVFGFVIGIIVSAIGYFIGSVLKK